MVYLSGRLEVFLSADFNRFMSVSVSIMVGIKYFYASKTLRFQWNMQDKKAKILVK